MSELSQLRLRCRRGMKELDIVLNKYLDRFDSKPYQVEEASIRAAFQELLLLEDSDLYAMLLGHIEPKNTWQAVVLQKLRK